MAHASEHLVIANIPDVTLTAYLTSVEKLAAILNLSVLSVETGFGLQSDDMVTPYAFPFIQAMGSSLTHLPESGSQGPIVIRAARLKQIRDAVIAYNAAIANEAAANGATLVDIYSLVNDLAAHGAVVGGQKLTTGFMGGFFSLDGIHPTNTGYAIIANEFIKTMNRPLRAGIPPVSVEQVSKTDPLIFPESDRGDGDRSHLNKDRIPSDRHDRRATAATVIAAMVTGVDTRMPTMENIPGMSVLEGLMVFELWADGSRLQRRGEHEGRGLLHPETPRYMVPATAEGTDTRTRRRVQQWPKTVSFGAMYLGVVHACELSPPSIFLIQHWRRTRCATIRDVRSALSYFIAGNLACQGVHEIWRSSKGNHEWALRSYFHAAFNAHHENDVMLCDLAAMDPAQRLNPRLDRFLHFHRNTEKWRAVLDRTVAGW